MLRISWLGALACAALLTACGERELILEGERLDLRAPLTGDETDVPAEEEPAPVPVAFSAPAEVANADWAQSNAVATNAAPHAALGAGQTRVWSVAIGSGNNRKHRITAAPVVADGRVFTLDSRAQVAAVSTGGQLLWTADITPATDRTDDASGGGLAAAGGRLFVTSGFGELVALDAATGAQLWSQDLQAAASGAPTVLGGQVFAAARDGRGWALDAATGRTLWTVQGTPARTGVVGGAAPAATDQAVIFPLASGELIAVAPATGAPIWTGFVAGERIGRVYTRVTDVTGAPVISGGQVFAASNSGRSTALDFGSGRTLWTAKEGAQAPLSVAGGSIFMVSDESELLRLDAATGERIWGVSLPFFTRERIKRRRDIFAHYGPILAGGRLVLASDDGLIRFFSPADGALLGTAELPGGAASQPVVAGGTLYIVSENGQLNAFR